VIFKDSRRVEGEEEFEIALQLLLMDGETQGVVVLWCLLL